MTDERQAEWRDIVTETHRTIRASDAAELVAEITRLRAEVERLHATASGFGLPLSRASGAGERETADLWVSCENCDGRGCRECDGRGFVPYCGAPPGAET